MYILCTLYVPFVYVLCTFYVCDVHCLSRDRFTLMFEIHRLIRAKVVTKNSLDKRKKNGLQKSADHFLSGTG